MKKIAAILLSLALSLSLLVPAWAANDISLKVDDGSGMLILEGVGDQSIYSVQLELTMRGTGTVRFSKAADGAEGSYGIGKTDGNKITIYIDSLQPLNRDGTISVGTLDLDGNEITQANLTLLGRDLDPKGIIDPSSSIRIQQASGSTPGGNSPGGSPSGGGSSGGNPSGGGSSGGNSSGSGSSDGNTSGDSNSGENTASSWTIRVAAAQHGKITVSPTSAGSGTIVTVTVQPDSGYQLSRLTATAENQEIALTDKGSGIFTFTMPAAPVEVEGVFSKSASVPVIMPFTDVAANSWYYDAVQYIYGNGLMTGISETAFGPSMTTSRGMIVTILHRLAGSPVAGNSGFDDVDEYQYYAEPVAWAAANGIVNGYGDGRFGPNDPITREQMAVILRGYAKTLGRDVSSQADLSGYRDADAIHAYALEAMRWANAVKIINGTTDAELLPSDSATRAQVAVILRGFCENIISD